MTRLAEVVGVFFALILVNRTVQSVAPLHGGAIFPRFQEFPDQEVYDPLSKTWKVAPKPEESPALRFRLPNEVSPRHYNLEIIPKLNEGLADRFTATGKVTITMACLTNTNDVVLHAADLQISDSSVKLWPSQDPSSPLTIANISRNDVNETYTVSTPSAQFLVAGMNYSIYIEFVARIPEPEERMNGLYLSSYITDSGDKRYVATTQFSRTRTFRKVLPSFDEPNQKAAFEISIGRQDPYHTLSNMNIRTSEPIDNMPGWTWDRYAPTPVMPPTVIAFVISDFANQTAPPDLYNPDKPISIWGPPPEMRNEGGVFAAQCVARILKHFESYFDIEYELPKMDSVGMPDFAAGAMENWGLNIYRTIYMLWYEGESTVVEKFRVANVIGHELTHQYWGNLVTHEWWNDWWLTEGFASYFEYTSLDVVHPEFEPMDRILASDMQPAMEFDAGPNSVPIHGNVTWEYMENPSVINYNKGAALVRMMQGFLGEEHFIQSLIFYLKKRSYTAVNQDDLFNDMTAYLTQNEALPSNGVSIKEIMDTWTLQTSFPLVRVTTAGPNTIYLTQERFQTLAAKNELVNDPYELWYVPIGIVPSSDPTFDEAARKPKVWMDKYQVLTSYAVPTNQWVVVNPDARGYYRVMYDNSLGSLLLAQLQSDVESIPTGTRSMLVDDYFTFAYQKYNTIEEALRMTQFMSSETNFNVWIPFMKHLTRGFQLFSSDDADFDLFKAFMVKNMAVVLNKIGFTQMPTESPVWTMLRVQLFDWACSIGHPGCVAEASRLFDIWRADASVNPIPVDIRQYIYCASTLATNSQMNWDFLWDRYLSTRDPLIRNSLACSSSQANLQRLLTKAITDPVDVPAADAIPLIQRVAMNSVGRPLVFNGLVSSYILTIGPTGVRDVITTLSTYIRSDADLTRLELYLDSNEAVLEPVMTSVNASLARITSNREWMTDFGNSMLTWLTNN